MAIGGLLLLDGRVIHAQGVGQTPGLMVLEGEGEGLLSGHRRERRGGGS